MKRFLSLLAALWMLPNISVLRGETTWNLVTDAANLVVGDQIIIASSAKDFALSTTQNTNNRGQAAIVKNGNQCTLSFDVQIITLKSGTIPNTFALSVGDGYLYAASSSSSNNYLRTHDVIDDNSSFFINIDENGLAMIEAQGNYSNRRIRYNNNAFSCYDNTTRNVKIYRNSSIVHRTITYNENSHVTEFQIAEGEYFTLKTPTEINGFVPVGWTLNPMETSAVPPSDLTNSITVTNNVTFYAVYALAESGNFEKVISPLENYSGTYLIVNENNNVAFNGGLENLDVGSNTINIDFNGNYILSDESTESSFFIISKIKNGYSIRSAFGKYIGRTAGSTTAGINTNFSTVYENTISIDENGDAVITALNSIVLRYNSASNAKCFRYYASSQQPIQLYKKLEDTYLCFCTSIDIISEPMTISENTVWNNPTSLSNVVTVNANALLTAHYLGNKNAENLVVENGNVDSNGGVFGTFLKHIEPSSEWGVENTATDGWYGIASPIGNVEISSVSGLCVSEPNDYDLYSYSEKDAVWLNSKFGENDFSKLKFGNGYLYASKEGTTLRFSGEFNSNDVYKNVSYLSDNESLKGFNLLGNPFPKAITLANIEGIEFSGFYVITDDGAWEAHVGNEDVIKPGEAFLVQTDSNAEICIKKKASSKRNDVENQGFIAVKVESNEYTDIAYAFLCSESENVIEMSKIPHNNPAIHSVSINSNAIAAFDGDVSEIPVSFKATTTGKYKISLKINDNARNVISYLHLIDRFSGKEIDMLVEDNYEFIGSPRDNENRFVIKLNPENCNPENDCFVFQNDNNFIINGNGTLQIVDMLGRIIISEEINGETMRVGNLKKGAYIVVIIGDGVKTQKIVIK